MKNFTFWKLIIFRKIYFVVLLLLSACGDLVEESDSSSCNSAIDARNYDLALSACSSRKDKASAYLGKAGLDIINLVKSSGSSVSAYSEPDGTSLGTDDVAGATVLNILQLSVSNISDYNKRKEAISKAKTNLDAASSLLQPNLNSSNDPLKKDEILLNAFAISFAMQLDQILLFDNKTTSTNAVPIPLDNGTLACTQVSGYNNNSAKVLLTKMDGHLWSSERNGTQCARVLNAYNASDNKSAEATALANWVTATDGGQNVALPYPYYDIICPPFISLTESLTNLALNIAKLSLSGDNTKAITEAQTSSDALLKKIGCFE